MRKIKRLWTYGKCAALLILFRPVAWVLRTCKKDYRNLWLIGERGDEARDNGYAFFQYMRREHPEENAVYVITQNSPDYEKVASIGKTVERGCFKHFLMYSCAKYLVSTHLMPCAPDLLVYTKLDRMHLRAPGKHIFLQHGIIMRDMPWLHYPKVKPDIFVSGAYQESEYLKEVYGHPEGVVKYLGLCRYDKLFESTGSKNMILVMPSWRGSKYPKGEAFLQTPFYKTYESMLNHPKILELLERLDMELVFYPHVEMQPYLNCFHAGSDRVILADKYSHDVQTLFKEAKMMVTDFSSVYFDVAYLRKPLLSYCFDEDDYMNLRDEKFEEGYFTYERDGFGPVCRDEDSMVEALLAIADSGFVMEEKYRERVDAFFPNTDNKNCERTYQAILALK